MPPRCNPGNNIPVETQWGPSGGPTNKPIPKKVAAEDIEYIEASGAVTGVSIKRQVTRSKDGSELMLGVCSMQPGEGSSLWSSNETNDVGDGGHWYGPAGETYFCISGTFRLTWDDGEADFGLMDTVYPAPGWHYRPRNVGTDEGFFVYNMYPSQE